jgi:hypothetical protein
VWREAPVVGTAGVTGSSEAQIGTAAAAGIEATGKMNGTGEALGVSSSGISRNSKRGG